MCLFEKNKQEHSLAGTVYILLKKDEKLGNSKKKMEKTVWNIER